MFTTELQEQSFLAVSKSAEGHGIHKTRRRDTSMSPIPGLPSYFKEQLNVY